VDSIIFSRLRWVISCVNIMAAGFGSSSIRWLAFGIDAEY